MGLSNYGHIHRSPTHRLRRPGSAAGRPCDKAAAKGASSTPPLQALYSMLRPKKAKRGLMEPKKKTNKIKTNNNYSAGEPHISFLHHSGKCYRTQPSHTILYYTIPEYTI